MSNQKTRELIAGWIRYTKDKKITSPSDVDLRDYLTSKGYSRDVFDGLIDSLPDSGPNELSKAQDAMVQQLSGHLKSYTKDQLIRLKAEILRA